MPDPSTPRRGRRLDPALHDLWRQRLARFAQTAQSVAAFCAAEGVSVNSFFYWKRQLATPAAAPDAPPLFLPIRVTPFVPVEIVLPSGPILRLAAGCDLAFVRALIDALAGAPC
jgi:hypothetical protein